MADLKIGHIQIDGKGKTKEEVRKEIMDQVNIQLNEMLGGDKKEVSKPTMLHIRCDESEDGSGFNSEIDSEGSGDKIMQMLVSVVIDVLASISNSDDNSRKVNPEITLMFINELVERMTYLEEQEDGGK